MTDIQPITQRLYTNQMMIQDMKTKKTHCKYGHKLNKDNSFIDSEGMLRCKKCIRDGNKKRYWKNPEKFREYNRINFKKWRKKNHQHVREIEVKSDQKRYKKKLIYALKWNKKAFKIITPIVLTHYGKGELSCVCCKEKTFLFLTLDHVNNNGYKERIKMPSRKGFGLYYYLYRVFKKTGKWLKGYQTLCMNCNLGRSRNKGICPHKELN